MMMLGDDDDDDVGCHWAMQAWMATEAVDSLARWVVDESLPGRRRKRPWIVVVVADWNYCSTRLPIRIPLPLLLLPMTMTPPPSPAHRHR